MIWPSKQLDFSRRYIVAIRNLRNADEELLDVTDAFRALRDGIPTSDPDIESRRDIYAVREVPGPHPAMGRPKRVR